ncbi:Acetyl-coenzyme A thioesterase (Acyl-CoA thioester hydrolase 12) (Acyl-coenzyme A thioesterase 12) (Acyl-CoA thioesterase 12) (Cytoplasmic acetyl-CoA hydrolase 1) (CACH-1) (mCACH-1) [Durusdinium trenchii]|uniref:Acetyl-coenzyme A thioesterase (Acyl-CoA thioester hydrolase 12) (Acyl-coenzyme A thioesterase 12) (Acyl-CoA thioesterase 12) (Cytoplasmic acetyl-CoA hydrolase 1) (CACH-1) (MCACH-1) n=1 Tax=Durusdinium trenchii TaxID=1381693 RepID=A0ABP0MJ86_9DINO
MGNAAVPPVPPKRTLLETDGTRARSAAASVVTLLKEIDASVCDSRETLNMSYLLEWMDATSCLAAERHCGRSAVTLVMDDLDFTENYCLLKRGERCILEGKVTRAFGSSMEVVVKISVAEVHSGTLRMVGNAYFMYVILKTEAEKAGRVKVEVPELVPSTAEEVLEFGLAERRRNFRKKREAQVAELVEEVPPSETLSPTARQGGALTFTELVLPFHANHMGNTFGGQIMHWMVKGAKTAVWLHLRLSCAPRELPDDQLGVGGAGCARCRSGTEQMHKQGTNAGGLRTEQLQHAWLKPESVDTVHFKAD